MIKREDLTIIIPHLGGTDEAEYALNQCLYSLSQSEPDVTVIVVVNGEKCQIKNHWGDIRVKKQGQCRAVNAGIVAINTPWVMVSNDDMIYPRSWLGRLITKMEGDYLCLSPKLIEPRAGAPTFEVYFCGGAGGDFDLAKWESFVDNYYNRPNLGWRTGFNLPFIIRRDLWETIGGYDVAYDPWGSNGDSDLEYKIKLVGIQPMQNTKSIVYHFSQTSGTFHPDNQGWWNKNWDYFIEKWGFSRTDEGIWEASFEIPDPPMRRFIPDWEQKYALQIQDTRRI